jgi:hypothetical protein
MLWFGTDVEGLEGRAAFGVPVISAVSLSAMDAAAVRALHPVLSRHVRTERFSVDVVPEAAGRTLLFRKRPDLAGTIYRISEGAQRVIARCDGARSLAQIAAETGAAGPGHWPRLARLVEFLHAEGIVAFARYPAQGPAPAFPGSAP